MTLGVTITPTEAPQSGGVPTDTGTAFFVGLADQGPSTAVKCQSLLDYTAVFGPRSTSSALLYDSVDVYFRERGSVCYVVQATDLTATTATLTLQDAAPHPTVVVSAATPGVDGNTLFVAVTLASNATFTANTTSGSPNLASISSTANLAVGTPVTGSGIPAGTYIQSVNVGASTAVLSANASATASAVVITPKSFTLTVQDGSGASANVLETHGPFISTAALYADTTSTRVTFTQSAGSGFTANVPVALSATALSGGANANDVTDSTYVTALSQFGPNLGPGQVAIPGGTSATITAGIAAHCAANNRFPCFDVVNNASPTTVISAGSGSPATATNLGVPATWVIAPGVTPGTTRTVPGSAVVAALRAQVSRTGNDNQAPAGRSWPLQYVTGPAQTYTDAQIIQLNNAGINAFTSRYGTLCLFGFSTTVPATTDQIFWQGSAVAERMALIADVRHAAEPFLFKVLDGRGLQLKAFQGVLQGIIAAHWATNALYGDNATDAGSVAVDPPVNTPATQSQGQLNAVVYVRISPFAQSIGILIPVVPITQTVPAA